MSKFLAGVVLGAVLCVAFGCSGDDEPSNANGPKDAGTGGKAGADSASAGSGGAGGTGGASGTGGAGANAGDAAPDACPNCPSGTHSGFVVSALKVPATNTQAREFGLDLDADGTVDNQLGSVIATLSSQGFDIQQATDNAVLKGDILTLFDFQTASFSDATGAVLSVKLGANPTPAPCTNPTDVATCGKHLAGTGTFDIAASSPTDASVQGAVAGGVFDGGPGKLLVQVTFGAGTPITLALIGARAKATGISATAMTDVILAGGVTQDEIDTQFLPSLAAQLATLIAKDCTGSPYPCGCMDGSTGKTLIGLFDVDHDCAVPVSELKSNSLIQSLLAPDLDIAGVKALSFGVKASAVTAKFPGI